MAGKYPGRRRTPRPGAGIPALGEGLGVRCGRSGRSVGQGRRLSDHLGGPLRLELVEGMTTSMGNLMLTYRKRSDETIVVA